MIDFMLKEFSIKDRIIEIDKEIEKLEVEKEHLQIKCKHPKNTTIYTTSDECGYTVYHEDLQCLDCGLFRKIK